ncbi:unnamed protein product, partial [Allacma fusca]
MVRQALPIQVQDIFGWTDSMIVLNWIQSLASLKEIFVANRVTKIQLRIPPESWYHVPGIDNPADLPSRGIDVDDLLQSTLWFHGPMFLLHHWTPPTPVEPSRKVPLGDAYTPTTGIASPQSTGFNSEEPQGNYYTASVDNIPTQGPNGTLSDDQNVVVANIAIHRSALPIIEDYSDINRLLRHTVWWSRFWKFILKAPGHLQNSTPITTAELNQARNSWMKAVQQECLKSDLRHLHRHSHVQQKSTIKPLSPYIDSRDGLLKAGGRLQNANLPEEVKHPVILPRHRFTYLLISSY